jgi:spore coat protein A
MGPHAAQITSPNGLLCAATLMRRHLATEIGRKPLLCIAQRKITVAIDHDESLDHWEKAVPDFAFSVPSSLRTGGNEYVWHCHILEHEEHDMMRPLIVL